MSTCSARGGAKAVGDDPVRQGSHALPPANLLGAHARLPEEVVACREDDALKLGARCLHGKVAVPVGDKLAQAGWHVAFVRYLVALQDLHLEIDRLLGEITDALDHVVVKLLGGPERTVVLALCQAPRRKVHEIHRARAPEDVYCHEEEADEREGTGVHHVDLQGSPRGCEV